MEDKFHIVTITTALGLTILACVLGVGLVLHGAVRLAHAIAKALL